MVRKASRASSRDKEKKQLASVTHMARKTDRIIAKQKYTNFRDIFNKLDSDDDGMISSFKIDISFLDSKMLQILSPLFIEMEELGMTLDCDEFIDAANRLYNFLPLPDKNVLMRRDSKTRLSTEPNNTF